MANHPFDFNLIFLSDGLTARRKERHVLRIYTAASQCYSAAMDGHRDAKLAWSVDWPFGRKTLLVEKSSEFKFGEYGGLSAKNQNFATIAYWFGRHRPALNPPKGIFSIRLRPFGSRDHMLSQKLLVDVGVGTFASENR
jgi:hypothetical protein